MLGFKQKEDVRDIDYIVRMGAVQDTVKYWDDDIWFGNQGQSSMCVGFSWRHWLIDGPILQTNPDLINAGQIYYRAKKVDEWAGENYNGTSIRGGAKVLKTLGYISTYSWATTIEQVINVLLSQGPLVVGTSWMTNMYKPNKEGIINISGMDSGGHAYVLNGIDTDKGLIRIKNSWGQQWGQSGRAYIDINDFYKLLTKGGYACIANEKNTALLPEPILPPTPKPKPKGRTRPRRRNKDR